MVCLPAGTAVSELLCRPCRPCYLNPAAAFQRESDPSALDGFPVFSGTVFRGGRRSFRRGKRGWGCDLLTTELQSVKSEAGLDTRAPGAPGAWGCPLLLPGAPPAGTRPHLPLSLPASLLSVMCQALCWTAHTGMRPVSSLSNSLGS